MGNYAIVVGIDDYREKPLRGAVADATAFAGWLQKSGQITNPDDLKLITSGQFPGKQNPPTDAEINYAVSDLYDQIMNSPTHRAKRIYFYFAGHGLGVTLDNTALCMRPWTQLLNLFCISSMKYLHGLINLDITDELFIILDCCRDIDVKVVDPPGPKWNHTITEPVNTKYVTISSTKYGERSQEIEATDPVTDLSRKRGAFTKFLLEALDGDAADANGNVYINNLFNHLRNNFKSYTTTLRYVQEADVRENLNGENILIHKVNGVAPQAGPPVNFILTFQRASNDIELQDGFFEEKKRGPVTIGDRWELNLQKGIYTLIDHSLTASDPKEKQIKNFNTNSVSHDEF